VDPDYFSQTSDQFLAKGAEGTYGNIAYYAEWLIMTDEEGYSQYESPEPLVSEYNDTQMWPAKTTVLSGGVAVTNVCEYPEAIVRLMDWFCTLEGTLIAQYGPENGTWEGGEGGWTLVTKDGVTGYEVAWPEKYANYNEFRKQELNPMALPIMSKPEGVPVGQYYTGLNPKQVKLTNDIVENFAPYYKVAFPMAKMTTEEAQEINSIETDLEPYVQQMEARFMIGEESFENYDAFIQGCKDRGSDRLVEIYQQIYDRFNSN
jgi:putative aldouronate transport system substrate-binding protein